MPGSSATDRRLLLARHGQTRWNLERRWQGQLDSPLTSQGVCDAQHIAEQAAKWPVDVIVCSPLGRARQTATIIAASVRVDVQVLDDLREIDHGRFAGFTAAELDAAHPGWREQRAGNLYEWQFPDGESYHDADRRARSALNSHEIAGASCPLVITHEMIARMLIGTLEHLSIEQALGGSLMHGILRVFNNPSTNVQV